VVVLQSDDRRFDPLFRWPTSMCPWERPLTPASVTTVFECLLVLMGIGVRLGVNDECESALSGRLTSTGPFTIDEFDKALFCFSSTSLHKCGVCIVQEIFALILNK